LTKQTSISLPDFCSMFSFAETTKGRPIIQTFYSLTFLVQNVSFSKKCFFCNQEFSYRVAHRHYKTSTCKINNFYSNGWSLQFEEVLNNDDLLNTDTLFDFSEEGPYIVIPFLFFLYEYFSFTWCAMALKYITSNTLG